MSDFIVNHSGYDDANAGFQANVMRMNAIMDDLDRTLNNISAAVSGGAVPLWEESQHTWDIKYKEMMSQLNTHTNASLQTADIFREGDNNGVRAMS